jgi:hypothetical protein
MRVGLCVAVTKILFVKVFKCLMWHDGIRGCKNPRLHPILIKFKLIYNTSTYQLKVFTFMIKTNYLN